MELPTAYEVVLDPAFQDHIKCWQERIDLNHDEQDQGIIWRLAESCQNMLQCLVKHLHTNPPLKAQSHALRRSLASLKLWCDGYGATRGALDSTLQRSKDLRVTTLDILNPLCGALAQGLRSYVVTTNGDETIKQLCATATELCHQTAWLLKYQSEDTSEGDSDSEANSSGDDADGRGICDFVRSIKTYIDCLIDLGMALACPALESKVEDKPSQVVLGQRLAHDYHTELITAKYPQANTHLLQSLGKISWERYLRMQRERDANASKNQAVISSNKSHSEFQDSGLGTTLPPVQSSYAESTVSFMTSVADGKRVQIPPLTAEAKDGKSFECNACGLHIVVTNNRAWRSHLYHDLQPYTCLYTECKFSLEPFQSRQVWSDHLELDHALGPSWKVLECPLCLKYTDMGKNKTLAHFARHMEDIAVSSLPRDVDTDIESDSMSSTENDLNGASDEDSATIKCICGFRDDDGDTVLCEKCDTWQHIVCYYESAEHVPDVHECTDCSPRWMDINIAAERQRKRQELSKIGRKALEQQRKFKQVGDVLQVCRECKKEFTRPCDLTKHEKTHIRPWKCSEETCKYFHLGWPTERQRDRHMNDKHNPSRPRYRCLFPSCPYSSLRESNCKQHMEKAHGWEYVRSRSNGRKKGPAKAGNSSLIPPTPNDVELHLFATPSISTSGPAATVESTTHDSVMKSDIVLGPQLLTPAFSANRAYEGGPMFPHIIEPDLTLYTPQSHVDEGFGDDIRNPAEYVFSHHPYHETSLLYPKDSTRDTAINLLPDSIKPGHQTQSPGVEASQSMDALSGSLREFSEPFSVNYEPINFELPAESRFAKELPTREELHMLENQFRTYKGPGSQSHSGTEPVPAESRTVSSSRPNVGDLAFVVANDPGKLKSKKNMNLIRKRAMKSYLKQSRQGEPSLEPTRYEEVMSSGPNPESDTVNSVQKSDGSGNKRID